MLGKHARPHLAAVGDNRNEAASHRASSRASSRRRMRPPKPLGNVKRKKPKRLAEKEEPRWRVASVKSTRANRSIAPSCEPIKTESVSDPIPLASWFNADDEPAIDADADATTNEGEFYPFSFL